MLVAREFSWQQSICRASINKILKNREIRVAFQTVIPGCEKNPDYLIGDPAYPFTPYCMKEFDNSLDKNYIF